MKLLARLGCRAERVAFGCVMAAFLAFSSYSVSCLICLVKAWTISKMVMRWRFLTIWRLLMGWLQCGHAICLLGSTLISSCMQGPQQVCWFMHIITGAYSSQSN